MGALGQRWKSRDGNQEAGLADHAPFGSAAKDLAAAFGVTMYLTFARDDAHHAGWDNERLLFSRANRLLTPCAIADGRSPAERFETVVTFTGQSLSVPPGAGAVLRMDDAAYDWQSPSIRTSVRGHAQAIVMPFGEGRLAVFGEGAGATADA